MNFYASQAFLETAAAVYFKGRDVTIEDVEIGGDVLRLLVVDGRPMTKLQFLDMHQPLAPSQVQAPVRKGRYARMVVRGVTKLEDYTPDARFELAPFVEWSDFPSIEAYRARQLQRHRGMVRDRERRGRSLASAHGEVVFTADDRADDVLPFARHWKSRQLQETGHFDYYAVPETDLFLAALRERQALVASTLRTGGRLAAAWLGFIHEGSWSGWVFTYDPAFRKYSVGHQLVNAMLEESYRRGHREFDFSEGAEDYKMIYATHVRLLGEIGRPPLRRAVTSLVKNTMYRLSPKLLGIVRDIKRNGVRSQVLALKAEG